MQQVVEPLGVRRATGAMLVLFAVTGLGAGAVLVADGQVVFALLFTAMFIGIPYAIHRTSRGPGVPGFGLTTDGIVGAAEDEHGVVAWGEVEKLVWRRTGLVVNDDPCLALHAQLRDGRSLRITSLPARRGREVDEVMEQVRATGLLPDRLADDDRSAEADEPAGDFPGMTQQEAVRRWADLPAGTKLVIGAILAAFVLPFVLPLVIIGLVLLAAAGPIGWLLAPVLVALAAIGLRRAIARWRTPVLACSFTVEGVVPDLGDGLTIPWTTGTRLRIDPLGPGAGTDLDPRADGRGWVVWLVRPDADAVALSRALRSPADVVRAVEELHAARRAGLVPADVELSLPADLDPRLVDQLRRRWQPGP